MTNKVWNITNNRAVWSGIRAVVRSEVTNSLVFELAVVGKYLWTPKRDVSARQFQWLCYLLQCQTPDITELLPASWASVVHPCLTCWTKGVSIVTLQNKIGLESVNVLQTSLTNLSNYLYSCTSKRTESFNADKAIYSIGKIFLIRKCQNLTKCTTTWWNKLQHIMELKKWPALVDLRLLHKSKLCVFTL